MILAALSVSLWTAINFTLCVSIGLKQENQSQAKQNENGIYLQEMWRRHKLSADSADRIKIGTE